MRARWVSAGLFLIAVSGVAAETGAPVVKGRLCIAERKTVLTDAKCADIEGTNLEIAAADQERLFLWTSADAKTAQIGVVAAKATAIALESDDRRELTLSIAGDASRGWPTDVKVLLAMKEQWRWVLPSKAVLRFERLFVPPGTYGIQLEAAHHRTLRRGRIAATEKTLQVGVLKLSALPLARGTVVDGEGKAIADAIVSFEDATQCATANEQGAFACELHEGRLEALVVSRSGFASNEVKLPSIRSESDVDLGRIVLTNGRPLTLKIIRPDAEKPARVTLFLDSAMRYEHSKLASREVTEREQEVKFDAGVGKYLVLVEGSEPLERLEVPIEIKEDEGETAKEIRVEPFRLEGTVRLGDEPLKGSIEIIAPENTWRHSLPVNEGAFSTTLWQPGKLHAFVSGPEFAAGELVVSPELGADPSRWDVALVRRMIVGKVFDAETRKPVANVEIGVVAQYSDGAGHFNARVEEDGSYRILANRPGKYMLKVASRQHVAFATEVMMTAEDKTRTLDIVLESGVLQPLDIVTPTGVRIAGATILEGVQEDRHNPQHIFHADASGRFALRGKPGETRLLYVVPQAGSFAVVRVQIPRTSDEAKPIQVVVLPPTGSLRVRTIDKDGQPVAALLLIRYNGEFVPGAIARFVTNEFVGTPPSGEGVLPRFPAGAYELWALAGDSDEVALIASGGALRAPERVGLSSGEQLVTLTAPPREQRRRSRPPN